MKQGWIFKITGALFVTVSVLLLSAPFILKRDFATATVFDILIDLALIGVLVPVGLIGFLLGLYLIIEGEL